ncbi:amino acid permease, partial [Mycobacterium kansasii]
GIVIGTGIFTLTGVQAKVNAGPGIAISFIVAGVVSLFAALCYAELASAVPTAGSAYTYAYATIGEVFAWIIGWDLLLEFGLGAAVVSRS